MAEPTPTPSPEQVPSSETPSWRDDLPEELKSVPALSKFNDKAALAKAYIEADRYIGGAVKVPGQDATPEERAAFYTKIGRPEVPEKYDLGKPPVGDAWDEKASNEFRRVAHANGLTQPQVAAVLQFAQEHIFNPETAGPKLQETTEILKKEWGPSFDYRIAVAQRAVKMGGPELMALMESGLGNHPVMVRYFEKVGRAMAEDGQILHDEVSGVRSPATARSEIQKIMADRNDVYYHADKPGHRERVDQVNKLFELASLEG